MPGRRCTVCGGGLPRGAVFCPHCGGRVTDDLPASASAAAVAQPHLYGVTPPMTLLALALALLAAGIVLIVRERPVLGAVLVALALVLGAAFVAAARRKPQAGSPGASDRLRERARLTRTTLAARAAARRDLGRLLREREQLRSARERLVRRLGAAVYEDDETATQSLRRELEELDRRYEAKEAEMHAVTERARNELERARLEVQPTEMVEVPSEPTPQPSPVPAPVPVPEPTPAPVPEPTPVPHEPVTPPDIPEPTPVPSPEPTPEEPEAAAPSGRTHRRRGRS